MLTKEMKESRRYVTVAAEFQQPTGHSRVGKAHRALVRERFRQMLPDDQQPDLAEDNEFLFSAMGLFRSLEELWAGLERQQTLEADRDIAQVRRLFLTSAVEWALDLNYEVREVRREQLTGPKAQWRVASQAWDRERAHVYEAESAPFTQDDARADELALIEALARSYTGAIGGLIGWIALDPAAQTLKEEVET